MLFQDNKTYSVSIHSVTFCTNHVITKLASANIKRHNFHPQKPSLKQAGTKVGPDQLGSLTLMMIKDLEKSP